MSLPSSSHAYGIGLIAVIIGAAVGISYYQLYFIPEYNAKPHLDPKIINPGQTTDIAIVSGSSIEGNPHTLFQRNSPFSWELVI